MFQLRPSVVQQCLSIYLKITFILYEITNKILFPNRAKRETLYHVYDELEVGILLCRTMDDSCNMSWKVYKQMEPLKGTKDWNKCYSRLWKLLEMQREHIMHKDKAKFESKL